MAPGENGGPVSYSIVAVAEEFSFTAVAPPAPSTRRGRPRKRTLTGGAFLDEFFTGGRAWREASGVDVWEAAREFVVESGGERGEQVPLHQGEWLESPSRTPEEAWHRPQFSALLYPVNALVNLALIHRAGGLSVRLQDVAGRVA